MKNFILWKVFLQKYVNKSRSFKNSGFTLIEAITSLLIGGVILSAALGGFISLRQLFLTDNNTTDINQRLRTIFGTIGPDVQQTGEGLIADPRFPAIVIEEKTIPASSDKTSEITIRKGDLIGFLSLCSNLTQGSSDPVNVIDDNGTSSCQVTDADSDGFPDSVGKWQGKRIQAGGNIKAYIYDSATGNNEFFDYTGEETLLAGNPITPTPSTPPDEVNLTTNSHSWQNNYNQGTSVVYLLEERRYLVNNNRIQLVINESETLDLVEAIEKMSITAYLQEDLGGTEYACKTIPPTASGDCTPGYPNPSDYSWAQIKSIELQVVAKPPENAAGNTANTLSADDLTLSQEFFPRNRLSF